VALALLTALGACTPAARPLTAVRVVGGQVTVLVATCTDFQLDTVSLYTDNSGSTGPALGPQRRLVRTGTDVPDSLQIFEAPPSGWSVAEAVLTALTPKQLYGLGGYAQAKSTVPIVFTAEDLAALGGDEVLVGRAPSSHEKVTEKKFRERAKKSC